jgi:medium-chain acyl-[acyl-carrier-protein] hydrolase
VGTSEGILSYWPNPRPRLRVLCFPYAGGGASAFNGWIDQLPAQVLAQIELLAVQLPGHESRVNEETFDNLSPLLDALVPIVRRYSDTPFAFVGHSMGALISFELARHLRRQKHPGPAHIVVSGHRAPQLPDPQPAIRGLPAVEFLARLREMGGTPEAVLEAPELMELLLPVLRADFSLCETYVYPQEEPLDCSITAWGGNDDRRVSSVELLAWGAQSTGLFSLHMFPGNHFFIHSARSAVLQVLAHDLRLTLRRLTIAGC